jgi:hypothetical protein
MSQANFARDGLPRFQVGDYVEVRSREEILATLDENASLENLPFMPEMFAYCGQRFRVYKSAHKTCDTINGSKGLRMRGAVHLDGVRCNGLSHDGCQASCLIFWKTAWLRKLHATDANSKLCNDPAQERKESEMGGCTEADVLAATRKTSDECGESAYACQATQLLSATEPLPWWNWQQYVEDYASGNVGLVRMLKGFLYMAYQQGLVNLGIGLGPLLRWIYDRFQKLRSGVPYPRRAGKLPAGERTPAVTLDLQPGELVRVKSLEEVRATCDKWNMNRGMRFDAELVPYCGGTYQVLKRVSKFLNEKTGKMMEMKTPCIILDSVVCQARYSKCRLFCPRSIYPFWREVWLDRVATRSSDPAEAAQSPSLPDPFQANSASKSPEP